MNDDFFFNQGSFSHLINLLGLYLNAWPPILLRKFCSAEILQLSPELRTKHHHGESSVVLM